jgi:saccharopine dehydrogenase (NADP+, L-glutamate forming)
LVEAHDHVISFIPPALHHHVAKACLEHGKNMTTSSYISPAVKEMESAVKAKGLIFLNECGLDPGIDILSTMKVVHEARAKGQ